MFTIRILAVHQGYIRRNQHISEMFKAPDLIYVHHIDNMSTLHPICGGRRSNYFVGNRYLCVLTKFFIPFLFR